MLGLTTLGAVHTAISLVAVAAGVLAFVRDKEIVLKSMVGKVYAVATILTCLTGFGIYEHGGFGAPHALGVITLVVLGVAWHAGRGGFGRASRYVETVSCTATFLFHMIPAVTETSTRLPLGSPWITDREGPELQAAVGIMFVLFLIGSALQVWRIRTGGGSSVARFQPSL